MPNVAKHYQPAPIERQEPVPATAAKEGLSFAFSTSEDKATGSFFNRAKLYGGMRLTSTLMNGAGDIIQKNTCNTIANMLGLWGNATYFVFGNNKNPVLGQLALQHGQWNLNGDYYEQTIPQAIPRESLDRISHIIGDDAHPKKAMMAKVDGEQNETKICIRADLFDKVQSEMRDNIKRRAEAFNIMSDTQRQIYSNDKTGEIAMSGILLNDVSDEIVREIHEITRNEWQIRTRIAGEDNASRHLEVHPVQLAEFEERMTKICDTCQDKFIVKRDTRSTHAPSFFKMMFQPHKYPVEHSVLMGGLMGNVLRMGGVVERAGKVTDNDTNIKSMRPEEFISNTMNIVSYMVELQPESSRHNRGDWEETGDEREFFTKESKSWGQDFLDLTDERPMLAGALIRPGSMAIKITGQLRELTNLKDKLATSNDAQDYSKDIRGQYYRLAAATMDAASLIVSGGLKKVDFGR